MKLLKRRSRKSSYNIFKLIKINKIMGIFRSISNWMGLTAERAINLADHTELEVVNSLILKSTAMEGEVEFYRDDVEPFKNARNEALQRGHVLFTFKGQDYTVDYAKYLIDYLDMHFR